MILTNQPGAASWPIAGATFILIHKQPQDAAAASEALKFFAWAYAKGGKMARGPRLRPDAGQRREGIKKTWASEIKGADGKPIFAMTNDPRSDRGRALATAPFPCPARKLYVRRRPVRCAL